MISENEKKILKKNLEKCENVEEMFYVLHKTFDLASCRPGVVSKPLFISGILKGINLVNPKIKPGYEVKN